MDKIVIRGAREHNLKNIDLELPRDRLIVVSGISGSGKSSLAFDTIFAEGQRRYVESLSSYARQFLGRLDKPDVDHIDGLSPAIAIEQKSTHSNPRSTVGTVTEIYDYLRLLYARVGVPHCPRCGREIREQSVDQIIDALMGLPAGARLWLLAPVVRGRKGEHQKVIEDARRAGFVRLRVDGEMRTLDEPIRLEKTRKHSLEIVVDRLVHGPGGGQRLADSIETALDVGGGELVALCRDGKEEREELFSPVRRLPRLRHQRAGPGAPAVLVQQPLRRLPRVLRPGGHPGVRPAAGHPRPFPFDQRGGHSHAQPQGQLASQHPGGRGPPLPLQPGHSAGRAAGSDLTGPAVGLQGAASTSST